MLFKFKLGQIVIDECIAMWGGTLESWPEKAVESINKRHIYI